MATDAPSPRPRHVLAAFHQSDFRKQAAQAFGCAFDAAFTFAQPARSELYAGTFHLIGRASLDGLRAALRDSIEGKVPLSAIFMDVNLGAYGANIIAPAEETIATLRTDVAAGRTTIYTFSGDPNVVEYAQQNRIICYDKFELPRVVREYLTLSQLHI